MRTCNEDSCNKEDKETTCPYVKKVYNQDLKCGCCDKCQNECQNDM